MSKGIMVTGKPVKPLSVVEQKKRKQLEGVIVANFQAFVQVGKALAEIRDRELYRESHRTFERYCRDLFDVAKSRAYQYIAAAEVVENVHNCGQKTDMLPINEAQVRPLTQLKPKQQIEVWQTAVDTAPQGKVTASHVNKVAKKYLGEKVVSTIRNAQTRVLQAHVSAEFKAAFQTLADQILIEKDANYKHTSRAEIVKHLDQLRAEIAEDGEYIKDPLDTQELTEKESGLPENLQKARPWAKRLLKGKQG